MSYTDMRNQFEYKELVRWVKLDTLAENDKATALSLSKYRRPNLKWISATEVDIENNVGTADETEVIFPGGELRTLIEDTTTTDKYRRFNITQTAEFTSGVENSGLRSGLSEGVNTWYAIYAVKSQIDETKFVLVGDTTLPLQANVATLDARYGAEAWLYIGMIRNGNGNFGASDILGFVQNGESMIFTNVYDSESAGIEFLNSGAATQSWAYSAGVGATQIPDHIAFVYWWTKLIGESSDQLLVTDSGGLRTYKAAVAYSSNEVINQVLMPAQEGVRIVSRSGTSPKASLSGFIDNALGLGFNPQF